MDFNSNWLKARRGDRKGREKRDVGEGGRLFEGLTEGRKASLTLLRRKPSLRVGLGAIRWPTTAFSGRGWAGNVMLVNTNLE